MLWWSIRGRSLGRFSCTSLSSPWTAPARGGKKNNNNNTSCELCRTPPWGIFLHSFFKSWLLLLLGDSEIGAACCGGHVVSKLRLSKLQSCHQVMWADHISFFFFFFIKRTKNKHRHVWQPVCYNSIVHANYLTHIPRAYGQERDLPPWARLGAQPWQLCPELNVSMLRGRLQLCHQGFHLTAILFGLIARKPAYAHWRGLCIRQNGGWDAAEMIYDTRFLPRLMVVWWSTIKG